MGENRQQKVVRGVVFESSGRKAFNWSAEQDRKSAEEHGGLASDAVGDGRRRLKRIAQAGVDPEV